MAEIVLGHSRPEIVVFIDTMGDGWRQGYLQSVIPIEPVLDFMVGQAEPLLWSEIPLHLLTAEQRAYVTSYKALGFADGLSMPFWGPNGYCALISMGSNKVLNLAPDVRHALQSLAVVALVRCRMLAHGVQLPTIHERPISFREADILYWVLEGKTDEEIGTIVGLGRATVKFHIRNATAKLGAANRITAAVTALKNGLLLAALTRNAVIIDAR